MDMTRLAQLRSRLDELAFEFRDTVQSRELVPGVDYLPPSGKVVGAEEFQGLLQASADMWFTAGRFNDKFEEEFPKYWGLKKCLTVNSGSSANLVALASLTSARLKDRALRPGDEVISAACGFPTTVAPIVQHGLTPVFVDVDLRTHNALVESVEAAITPKTKAIVLAHALGNPFRADLLKKLCERHGLWLVEDCCDALGAKIGDQLVGTFGDLATCSFYPAHHMTMGEGGAVLMDHANLYKVAMSFRDWGRDCWCPPGVSDSCGTRFEWQLGQLPKGYDHKYMYSHLGYNLKLTDFQAAIGLAQLAKLPGLVKKRQENHAYLHQKLKQLGLEEHLILPEATEGTTPSWFGYFVVLKRAGLRTTVVPALEKKKVGTRLLFAGNLIKQPAFQSVNYRVVGSLAHTDKIMNDGFWVGVWPGLGEAHLDYIAEQIRQTVTTA